MYVTHKHLTATIIRLFFLSRLSPFQVEGLCKPEFEDPVSVVAPAHENHSVPDTKMVNAWNDEHSPWSVLLQVLVLDS